MEDRLINLVPTKFFYIRLLLLSKPYNIFIYLIGLFVTLTVNPDLVCHEQWLSKSARAELQNLSVINLILLKKTIVFELQSAIQIIVSNYLTYKQKCVM